MMSTYSDYTKNFIMPRNPYTYDYFSQRAKNRASELQNAMLSSQQTAASPTVSSGNYGSYGAGYETFQKNLSAALARSGNSADWANGITELVKRESGFNPNAKNPKSTAYGYAQFLKSTRANYEKKTGLSYDNPVNQIIMMMQYVKDRYGSPTNAINFWNKNKWY